VVAHKTLYGTAVGKSIRERKASQVKNLTEQISLKKE
jgi:hypothetical protein